MDDTFKIREAAELGILSNLKKIIEKRANNSPEILLSMINSKDIDGLTPLHLSAGEGHFN